jgi:hypothetical protein
MPGEDEGSSLKIHLRLPGIRLDITIAFTMAAVMRLFRRFTGLQPPAEQPIVVKCVTEETIVVAHNEEYGAKPQNQAKGIKGGKPAQQAGRKHGGGPSPRGPP